MKTKALRIHRQFITSILALSVYSFAFADGREIEFNNKLRVLVKQSAGSKAEDERFKTMVEKYLRRVNDPKLVTWGNFALEDQKAANFLLKAFEAYPGSSQAALQLGNLVINCDVEKDRPDFQELAHLWGPPLMSVYNAFRMLLASGESLHLDGEYKKRVTKSVLRLIHHENEGPTPLIEAAVFVAISNDLIKHHWNDSKDIESRTNAITKELEDFKRSFTGHSIAAIPQTVAGAAVEQRSAYQLLKKEEFTKSYSIMKRTEALLMDATQ
jgi:hypothetical protein